MTKHDDWLVSAKTACSFRRMYALAAEILNESDNPGVRSAAARVVEALEGVIDLPIASAKQLQRGRQRFARLMDSVGNLTEEGSNLARSVVVDARNITTRVNSVDFPKRLRARSRSRHWGSGV